MWEQLIATDLRVTVPALQIPVYFLEGTYDYTCVTSLARDYFQQLQAPVKGFYLFDNSAHSPLLEAAAGRTPHPRTGRPHRYDRPGGPTLTALRDRQSEDRRASADSGDSVGCRITSPSPCAASPLATAAVLPITAIPDE